MRRCRTGAKLWPAVGAPVVIFSYTGHEEAIFLRLRAGRNLPISRGTTKKACAVVVPDQAAEDGMEGPREIVISRRRVWPRKNEWLREWARTIPAQGKKRALQMSRCSRKLN